MVKQNHVSHSALNLNRCPHCSVASPFLPSIHQFQTNDSVKQNPRKWHVYVCSRCGGAVLGSTTPASDAVSHIYPQPQTLQDGLPAKAASFLRQAIESVHAPSGAIMLCASSVDAMLKDKGLKNGSLYTRIEEAAKCGLITKDMAAWAHEVRLDANDERHADDTAPLPNEIDARRCIDFTNALGMFVYVLPTMVQRGRTDAMSKPEPAKKD
jgi:hypothetical protein